MRKAPPSSAAFIVILMTLASPAPAPAHPMGNFSISHFTSISIRHDLIHVSLFIDLAEIPSVEELKTLDADHDGQISPAEKDAYLKTKGIGLTQLQSLTLNGKPVTFEVKKIDL